MRWVAAAILPRWSQPAVFHVKIAALTVAKAIRHRPAAEQLVAILTHPANTDATKDEHGGVNVDDALPEPLNQGVGRSSDSLCTPRVAQRQPLLAEKLQAWKHHVQSVGAVDVTMSPQTWRNILLFVTRLVCAVGFCCCVVGWGNQMNASRIPISVGNESHGTVAPISVDHSGKEMHHGGDTEESRTLDQSAVEDDDCC